MKKSKFTLNRKDVEMFELMNSADQLTLAFWAIDCAARVMPYFTEKHPEDERPRKTLRTLREWIKTGVFKMSVIRRASLDSHAAAHATGEDDAARSAACLSLEGEKRRRGDRFLVNKLER